MGETIIFLHKIIPGSVDHSYGIQVANLAGLPKEVLDRAHEIMDSIEQASSRDLRDVVQTSSKTVPLIHQSYNVECLPFLQDAL